MENFEQDHYWQFFLRDNPLTKDDTNDCIAEIATAPKTLRAEDIAKEIKRRGSELEYETILSVISQHNRLIIEYILDGHSVMTDICQMTPRITGLFASSEAQFDAKIHKLTLDIVLSAGMRESLKKVKTTNLGPKRDVARIGLVTDTVTGLTTGTITPNDDIRIDGDRIKIVGDENTTGVFFIAEDGTATKVTRRLTQNDPKTILARVPALTAGRYTLRIVTNYSHGGTLLKEPRTLEYPGLSVINIGDDDRPVIE